ncbi:DUF3472 domain-containing protein [Bacteroides sp. 519]|uniref:DUF3472 domain-containing protein n=1 Tax=Bacteroides sp. 519 TaxID=2302937 RepID=UPI0013D29D92|nr:DUF3472 domain-containing protein [Bacteroides sp. 519]NDV59460.1 DUF3472 domain-containing protein [Bacteroides sp. 519]
MNKKLILILILFSIGLYMQAQSTLNIRLSGNAYVTSHREGANISNKGLEKWVDPASIVSSYFYLHEKNVPKLSLLAKGHSQIEVSCLNQTFNLTLDSDTYVTLPVGVLQIESPGYVRIDIKGLTKKGETFGEIQEIILDDVKGDANYVKDFSDYWGRRGPSVHLGYPVPNDCGDVEWFYNEIMVPQDGEVMHSYYMAAGFGEGYFGMQFNSPTERRILFSVWSPFETQNPKDIPEEYQVKMLRRGEGVHIGEFGNEGSGGQSYLRYPWKAGNTYKFLMQVHPDGKGNTIYTAYFYATDEARWRLIASFMRPKTDTWYKRPHSFLENFSPTQGYLSRKVCFNNQWIRTSKGEWIKLTEAKFTHDATAKAKVRLDYQGGVEGDWFYLMMGGFFNESVEMGTMFQRPATGNQPVIDFEELKGMK